MAIWTEKQRFFIVSHSGNKWKYKDMNKDEIFACYELWGWGKVLDKAIQESREQNMKDLSYHTKGICATLRQVARIKEI